MGNSNLELDVRIQKVERLVENYRSPIEPKSGEFIGQNWYDQSTEVLNMWNGREFKPAYGNSIIQDIEGNKTLIQQNTDSILLRVETDQILAEINLSSEGVFITGDRIQLNGDVQVQGSFSITSISDAGPLSNKDYINSNDLSTYTNTADGIYMSSTGLVGYYLGNKTIDIDVLTGNATFQGTIKATDGEILGTLNMGTNGSIQVGSGGKIDMLLGSTIGLDGGALFVINSGKIFAANTLATAVVSMELNTGIPLIRFIESSVVVGEIYGVKGKQINIGGTTVSLDCLTISQDFYIGDDLVVQDAFIVGGGSLFYDDITLSGTTDLILNDTTNRIKSGIGEIYYNGTVWRKKDSVGWSDL